MRHTKIIATLGPASASREIIAALVAAGVDVFRLNFSHGDHDSHAESFARIREIAGDAGRHVGIMQDLSGPKIRTGPLAGDRPLPLTAGETIVLAAGHAPSQPGRIFTPYAELIASAKSGDRLLLDDGRIELRVLGRSAVGLEVAVVHGGPLGAHKGINAPGVALPPSALTDKDVDDLRFGLSLGVDFVALSFVQTAADVARAREIITAAGRTTPVIAKIERPAALENLEAILKHAQGVMVARGDLGLEMPLEQVPRAQKQIIRCARALGLPAIVATQVLRVDARRAASDARRGQRRRERRRGGRRRDHAGGRDRRRRISRPRRANAGRRHPRRRVDPDGHQSAAGNRSDEPRATATRWRRRLSRSRPPARPTRSSP